MSEPTTDAPPRARWPWAAGAAALLVGALWYWWPGLSGEHGDVAVVADGGLSSRLSPLDMEVRARGRDVVAHEQAADWCALADRAPQMALDGAAFVVVAVTERGGCSGDPVAAALDAFRHGDHEPVVVVLPGSFLEQADLAGVRVAPVASLVGPPGQRTMPCEWWDRDDNPVLDPGATVPAGDCGPDGVEVRSADGELTDAGVGRIARMVASVIG